MNKGFKVFILLSMVLSFTFFASNNTDFYWYKTSNSTDTVSEFKKPDGGNIPDPNDWVIYTKEGLNVTGNPSIDGNIIIEKTDKVEKTGSNLKNNIFIKVLIDYTEESIKENFTDGQVLVDPKIQRPAANFCNIDPSDYIEVFTRYVGHGGVNYAKGIRCPNEDYIDISPNTIIKGGVYADKNGAWNQKLSISSNVKIYGDVFLPHFKTVELSGGNVDKMVIEGAICAENATYFPISGNVIIHNGIYAPKADITISGNAEIYGKIYCKSLTINSDVIIDGDI